ncbi:hypothetical protein KP509_33G048800 [Ceratopteris richardii]|uniref:KOW domain-containing protein n=1 Tax=Ceratopteris richardii TaxID=49495 RepID=A0A8T2QPD4_CERRI|nr:hypothetical protein KP509_33G048800 [Ceratopteris richardii]
MAAMASLQQALSSLSINGSSQKFHVCGLSSSSLMGVRVSMPRSFPEVSDGQRRGIITMVVRRWERKKCKPNSLPVWEKLHVKVGDTIKVIAGSDKGKISEITRVYRHNSKVLVKDVNLKTKHMKGKQEGESGQIVQIEAPIHSSNVMLYSKKEKVASRVGHKVLEDGRKVRYLLKTGEILDSPEDWKRIHKDRKKE